MANLESFEATINPDRSIKNNVIVCRVNNETKEYWLAKATCSPWVATAADNLEDIPDGTSVGSGGYAGGWWVWLWLVLCPGAVQCAACKMADARPCPPL